MVIELVMMEKNGEEGTRAADNAPNVLEAGVVRLF
jgi:hypothetical protein